MNYFTTMNLPAPTFGEFSSYYKQYEKNPHAASQDFQNSLQQFFGSQGIVLFSNCFTAIAIGLYWACLDRPQNVAVSSLGYRRSTDIIKWSGLNPIYVDNDYNNLGMSYNHLEQILRSQDIGCILAQHPMVTLLEIDKFEQLSDKYNVPIIFDSVEATGEFYGGKKIGNFGLMESFSLHPSKVLNAAEGGILSFGSSDRYCEFTQFLTHNGLVSQSDLTFSSGLFDIEPLHAVMGLASVDAYPSFIEQFKSHYQIYQKIFSKCTKYFALVEYNEHVSPNYKTILIRLSPEYVPLRTQLLMHLESLNIGARAYYYPLHSNIESYLDLPQTRRLALELLFLPIGHSVSDADVEYIANSTLSFFSY